MAVLSRERGLEVPRRSSSAACSGSPSPRSRGPGRLSRTGAMPGDAV